MRTLKPPELRRRPLHHDEPASDNLPLKKEHHSPELFPGEDMDVSHDEDEIDDVLDVDDGNTVIRRKVQGLYPDLSDLQHIQDIKQNFPAKEVTSSGHSVFIKALLICFVLFMGGAFWIWMSYTAESSSGDIATKIIRELNETFVNQPSLSFRIIKKALAKVIGSRNSSESASAPAILLLASSKGAKDITACFAKKLANLVAYGDKNYQIIHGDKFQTADPDTAKKEIDDMIIHTLKFNKQKVILIEDLDIIPFRAATILFSYCDHENAPYKDVVFIMTVDTDTNITDNFDAAAESRLISMWSSGMNYDIMMALLSRITVSVAAILHEAVPRYCNQ